MLKTIGEDLKATIGKVRSKPPSEDYERNYDFIFRKRTESSRICNLCQNYMLKVTEDIWRCNSCGSIGYENSKE